jgi:hypothetical protein
MAGRFGAGTGPTRVIATLVALFSATASANQPLPLPRTPVPARPVETEEAGIPRTPTAPPSFTRNVPPETTNCERRFMYKGRLLACDSNLRQDGERLRPIMREVPAAVAELDSYQRNRRRVQTLAYVGTAGIATAAIGSILSRQLEHPTSVTVRNLTVVGGLALTAASVIYGFGALRANEAHLSNAVKHYNTARPEDPIELQFSTSLTF